MGVWKRKGGGGADRERGFAVDASSCNKPKKKRGKVTPSF